MKAAEDAFNGVVWTDDARASDHVLRRRYSPKPHLEIEIHPIVTMPAVDGSRVTERKAMPLQGALL